MSCSTWSSLSCCFSSTGIAFQYSVLAVCRSNPVGPRRSSSLKGAMGAPARVVVAGCPGGAKQQCPLPPVVNRQLLML